MPRARHVYPLSPLFSGERVRVRGSGKLDVLEKAGKLKRIPFTDRAEMNKLVAPVMTEYAKEIGADAIYAKIAAIQ